MQSHDRNPVSCRFPPLLTALVPCAVFLTSAAVTANNLLSPVSFPPNVTLCEPVNFTWAGGTPPYWLYIYGDLGNSKLLAQNTSGILTTWFVWIPDIPAVPRSLLRVRLGDSMTQTGFFSPMLVGSETSSCLGAATPPAAIPQASSTPGPATPSSESQPSTDNSTTSSPGLASTTSQSASIPTTSSTDRLNRAVRVAAGVAVPATVVGLGLVLVLVLVARRVLARRKNRARHDVQPPAAAGAHDRDTAATSLTSPTSQTSAPGALAGEAMNIDPYLHPYPYAYPAPPAMRESLASGPELDLETNETVAVRVSVPTPLARAGTGGYSVMADVGGARSVLGRHISLSRETDVDPSLSPVGNHDFRPSVGEALRGVHHWLQRKHHCIPVEARLHDRAGLHPCQELGGVLPPAVGGPERASTRQVGREATEPYAHSIRGAEADGWDIRSLSEGTTLPPYVP